MTWRRSTARQQTPSDGSYQQQPGPYGPPQSYPQQQPYQPVGRTSRRHRRISSLPRAVSAAARIPAAGVPRSRARLPAAAAGPAAQGQRAEDHPRRHRRPVPGLRGDLLRVPLPGHLRERHLRDGADDAARRPQQGDLRRDAEESSTRWRPTCAATSATSTRSRRASTATATRSKLVILVAATSTIFFPDDEVDGRVQGLQRPSSGDRRGRADQLPGRRPGRHREVRRRHRGRSADDPCAPGRTTAASASRSSSAATSRSRSDLFLQIRPARRDPLIAAFRRCTSRGRAALVRPHSARLGLATLRRWSIFRASPTTPVDEDERRRRPLVTRPGSSINVKKVAIVCGALAAVALLGSGDRLRPGGRAGHVAAGHRRCRRRRRSAGSPSDSV